MPYFIKREHSLLKGTVFLTVKIKVKDKHRSNHMKFSALHALNEQNRQTTATPGVKVHIFLTQNTVSPCKTKSVLADRNGRAKVSAFDT